MNVFIPVTTIEGYEYLLEFSSFNNIYTPKNVDIEIVDITLKLVKGNYQVNNAGTLSLISFIVSDFMESNDVILYFYCDVKDIKRRNNAISPQKYRSLLFSKIFEKELNHNKNADSYVNKIIILKDTHDDEHYIHLISKSKNEAQINTIILELNKLNK